MRVFDELDISRSDFSLETFELLPTKAKLILFTVLHELAKKKSIYLINIVRFWEEDFYSCNSPIESIFMMAFNIVSILREKELNDDDYGVSIFPQHEIQIEKKKYYADFFIWIQNSESDISVLVECDGHDFHEKTKEQVEKDNEREYELKMAGYEILRFSGSQIYNNPFKCANDVYDYLILKEKRLG